jgi:putative phage-type endonuclease
MTVDLIQGTDEWRLARCGSLGASRVADAVAKVKSGWGASRANLMAELIAERLTGVPAEGYTNAAMQWGTATEPQARAAYEWHTGHTVEEVGLIRHPSIQGTHASPDGLVGTDAGIEIKCPNSATHIETLITGKFADRYVTQMMWFMSCAELAHCDFVSFDPRLPENLRLFVKRVNRDDNYIARLEKDVTEFLTELSDKVAALEAIAAGRSVVKEQLTESLNILSAG